MANFALPKPSERSFAIALLVLINLAMLWAVPATVWQLQISGWLGAGRAQWPILVYAGMVIGQVVWLCCWFSLSQTRLTFRLAVLTISLFVGSLQVFLFPVLFTPRFPTAAEMQAIQQWICYWVLRELALVLCFYAVLLPIRRLWGLAVGVTNEHAAVNAALRQFRIAEWMGWTAIAVLPLAILRWLDSGDQFLEMLLFFYLAAFGSLALGVPMFCASLMGTRSVVAVPIAIVYAFAIAWLHGEGAYRLGLYRGGPMVEFRVAIAVLVPAIAAICLNNLVLQFVGIRLLVRGRQSKPVTVARGVT
jgi:hypothetical protein